MVNEMLNSKNEQILYCLVAVVAGVMVVGGLGRRRMLRGG